MYGHVNQYLDAEALRLRAERAERLARGWRNAALILLALLGLQTWLVIDTAIEMRKHREAAERRGNSLAVWHQASMSCSDQVLACSSEVVRKDNYFRRAISRAYDLMGERDVLNDQFRSCLSANQGLVAALREFDLIVKEQQQVIRDTLDAAKRCEASPVTWAAAGEWEVVRAPW